MNLTTIDGREGGTQTLRKCSAHHTWFPEESHLRDATEFPYNVVKPTGSRHTMCGRCGVELNKARPKSDDGKGLKVDAIAALRRVVAKEEKLAVPASAVKRIHIEKFATETLKWSHEDWVKVDTEVRKRYEAQSGNPGTQPPMPMLTEEDRNRYRSILGPAVKQSVDARTQERNKPSAPRQLQNIWLTEIEENIAAKINDYKCFGCGYEYGSYTDVGNKHYEKVDPEQMHVTKTRKMGGTKEDVRLGCGTCNDIHGNGEGMPDADFKAMIKKAHEERGYRNVRLTEVTA